PKWGASLRIGPAVGILGQTEREPDRFAKLRVLDLLEESLAASDLLDQRFGVLGGPTSHHASNGLPVGSLSDLLSGRSRSGLKRVRAHLHVPGAAARQAFTASAASSAPGAGH